MCIDARCVPLLPPVPYDPRGQGDPLHAEFPAKRGHEERVMRARAKASMTAWLAPQTLSLVLKSHVGIQRQPVKLAKVPGVHTEHVEPPAAKIVFRFLSNR